MSTDTTILVGDIGGTNCRLALVSNGQLQRDTIATYADASYPTLTEAMRAYLRQQRTEIDVACLAIAGPVTGDSIKLTNHAWHFSIERTRKELNLKALEIINDFEAIVLALPHLGSSQLEKIGGSEPQAGKPKVALGPGTGYGAAKVIRSGGNDIALPSEGGHVSIAPSTERELALCQWLLNQHLQITRELLLSGRGIERIYQALCDLCNATAEPLSAAEIQTRAVAGSDAHCVTALNMFCELLGTAARDQTLDALAQGGVYIAGGIVKRFIPFLRNSKFRQRFENSDMMRSLLEPIPVYVITEEYPGLIGAAAHISAL